jgi:serine/threonine-protein kinase RsbW
VSEEKTELNLPSRLESVEKAATEAEIFVKQCGFGDDAVFQVDMAVREAVANAVKHGNLLDETKRVEITFECSGEAIEITVRDFGKGFAVEEIPDPTEPGKSFKSEADAAFYLCVRLWMKSNGRITAAAV